MYLSAKTVVQAINHIKKKVHPFIGITFIACKRYGLTVGAAEVLSMDALTRSHLKEHHMIDRGSAHFFQPFRGQGAKWWVDQKYPSAGLQTVNTQTFPSVFLHEPRSREWGFAEDYLQRIVDGLTRTRSPVSAPADALAIWLFKGEDLGSVTDINGLVDLFFKTYQIAPDEQRVLFGERAFDATSSIDDFVSEPLSMTDVARAFPPPPDAEAEGGRTIASLKLINAGPGAVMQLDFGERLSLITGDNGLGKSFLLDFAWWAATGEWAEREAVPPLNADAAQASVEYALRGHSGSLLTSTATFDRKLFAWSRSSTAMTVEALAVFSRADGSFAIADPLRKFTSRGSTFTNSLSAYEVWNGRAGVIEGLIRDWPKWQAASDKRTFDRFSAVLKRLSPDDLGALTPGAPIRLPGDPRDIPTIQHNYGTVPVTHASSGVQRVLLLAYLIILTWQEHEVAAEQTDSPVLRRMLVIVDELEAHLHPKWQRIVLPALMSVGDLLSSELVIQMVAATHSPMILASMETVFDADTDVLYHLYGDGPRVRLEDTPFVKYGDASGWLTSPLFGLRHARSREAERAIEDAKSLQLLADVTQAEVAEVSGRLKRHLSGDDKFWPRWLYFAEQHGVIL
ncbi:MAG: AAA family ATPase [Paracoccus sp. (in: a-proteobacteria)]|nr:AAA family ATPase [Paracoccus sp. (in: a-proteobacteria)]